MASMAGVCVRVGYVVTIRLCSEHRLLGGMIPASGAVSPGFDFAKRVWGEARGMMDEEEDAEEGGAIEFVKE